VGVGTGATSLLDQAKEGKMRRVMLMLAAMVLMVSLFAAVAYAATIVGTRGGDQLFESDRKDTISGRTGKDFIDARMFVDDTDEANGNRGADIIRVDDGDGLDTVHGGMGIDACVGDFGDELDCEDASIAIP
jgi:Ca2+-binding RTX toxin-like protein